MENIYSGTIINEYLTQLGDIFGEKDGAEAFKSQLFSRVCEKETGPFLSIVTRTQGRRPQALAETMLCLCAQTNMNFELLVMGHNLTLDSTALVESIIEETPEFFQEKIRLIPVNGGNRTTPLNVGFSQARGRYITILDDDDIIFDNWVDSFYQCSVKKPGTILHAYAVSQKWEAYHTTLGADALMAAGTPNTSYCRDFNMLDQMTVNYCPTMSYATPRYAYQDLGIHFDETLTTTEDWDFLMRTAFVTGVSNIDQITSIYRLWESAESSQTMHSKEEWDKNYSYIIKKFLKAPVLMPADALDQYIRALFQDKQCGIDSAYLYYDDGSGLSDNKRVLGETSTKKDKVAVTFKDLDQYGPFASIRFDPMEHGFLKIKWLDMTIHFAGGEDLHLKMDSFETNGVWFEPERQDEGEAEDGYLLFLKSDPQFFYQFETPVVITAIECRMEPYGTLTDEEIDVAAKHELHRKKVQRKKIRLQKSLLYRVFYKIYRKFFG